MRKILILIVLLLSARVQAQSFDDGYSHHQIGLEASMLSGVGGTYSYIFDSTFRVKTTLWAYYEDQGGGVSDWTGSIGLQFESTLIRTELSRFYCFVGGFYFSHVNKQNAISYLDGATTGDYTTTEHDFAAGIGIGFEIMVWRHIALNIDGSFEYGGNNYNPASNYSRTIYIGPGIGVGLGYRF